MKIKIFVLLILFCFSFSFFGYEYWDESGMSLGMASYQGRVTNVRAYDLWLQQKRGARVNLSKVEKLTKVESNLLWGALNEYNYNAGEVYNVIISNSYEQLFLWVEIQKDGSAIWYGWQGPSLSSLF